MRLLPCHTAAFMIAAANSRSGRTASLSDAIRSGFGVGWLRSFVLRVGWSMTVPPSHRRDGWLRAGESPAAGVAGAGKGQGEREDVGDGGAVGLPDDELVGDADEQSVVDDAGDGVQLDGQAGAVMDSAEVGVDEVVAVVGDYRTAVSHPAHYGEVMLVAVPVEQLSDRLGRRAVGERRDLDRQRERAESGDGLTRVGEPDHPGAAGG